MGPPGGGIGRRMGLGRIATNDVQDVQPLKPLQEILLALQTGALVQNRSHAPEGRELFPALTAEMAARYRMAAGQWKSSDAERCELH